MFYIWEVKFELKSDSVLAVQFFRFYRLQHITSGMRFDAFTTINRPYVLYTMHVWPAFSFLLFFFNFLFELCSCRCRNHDASHCMCRSLPVPPSGLFAPLRI